MLDVRDGSGRGGRALRAAALLTVAALVLVACGGGRSKTKTTNSTPGTTGSTPSMIDTSKCSGDMATGIEGDTIKLGTSLPQSSTYSAFAEILEGEKAYFEYLNALGGVEVAGKKYKIELVDKDDQYQAEKTVTNVNDLINNDKVFALFNVVGTKNNLAIRDIVEQQCVPDLFAATGSPAWGNHAYPWILGTELVPYPLEMKALVDYLKDKMPNAKVAILRASDDFGKAYSDTFKKLIDGTHISVAQEQTYNAEQFNTTAQITSLAATKADVLILGATLVACPSSLTNVANAGWKPLVYMSGTCTSKTLMSLAGAAGDKVFSVAPLLDPADPSNDSKAGMKLYKEQIAKLAPKADPQNAIVAYGWTTAALMAETLKRSPKLTRDSVMETARTLKDVSGIGLMLDGQKFNVNANDWFLGESFDLVQYDATKKFFAVVKSGLDEDGKTASYTPEALING